MSPGFTTAVQVLGIGPPSCLNPNERSRLHLLSLGEIVIVCWYLL
jgi:hypothetical protein